MRNGARGRERERDGRKKRKARVKGSTPPPYLGCASCAGTSGQSKTVRDVCRRDMGREKRRAWVSVLIQPDRGAERPVEPIRPTSLPRLWQRRCSCTFNVRYPGPGRGVQCILGNAGVVYQHVPLIQCTLYITPLGASGQKPLYPCCFLFIPQPNPAYFDALSIILVKYII